MTRRGRPRKEKPPFAPHSGRIWRDHDVATLGRMIGQARPASVTAHAMGRTVSAVTTKASKLGLDFFPLRMDEDGITAVVPRVVLDEIEARAARAGMSAAHFAGQILVGACKPVAMRGGRDG